MSVNSKKQQPALPYDSGFAFTSIALGQKRPKNKAWNSRKHAITHKRDAVQLLAENVGLLHAYCSPNTCALDIDNSREAQRTLFIEAGIDYRDLKADSKLARLSSGRPNSEKIIFILPEAHQGLLTQVVRDHKEKVIFELRCADSRGRSVCDVIPPSLHPIGTRYSWVNGVGLQGATEIPGPLLEYWLDLIKRKVFIEAKPTTKDPNLCFDETPRQVALLDHLLSFISADCSRDKWMRIVFSILSTHYSAAEEIAYKWSITSERFTHDDFNNLIKSYSSDRAGADGAISLGTIYFYAKQGGWHG